MEYHKLDQSMQNEEAEKSCRQIAWRQSASAPTKKRSNKIKKKHFKMAIFSKKAVNISPPLKRWRIMGQELKKRVNTV